jgi:hypothetical protein
MIFLLLDMLASDLHRAEVGLRTNYNDQYYRRTAVRALAATVEGAVFCAKQMTLVSGRELNFSFNQDDEAFLKEERVDPQGKKRPFPTSPENIKRTFRLFAKAGGIPSPTDFGQAGFEALCQTFELRHSLMHPKSFMKFCVTDAQAKKAGEAITWFTGEIAKLVGAIVEDSDTRQFTPPARAPAT